MRMESADIADQNIKKIGALFPNVITEAKDENGKLTKAINFELLKQELSKEIVDGDEAYEFTWVGKKAAIVEANKPIRKTLRPCKEESINWDTTENLYIEGDNLEVLKLLQESYLGKVKMIYIDPPYNTGNDFIYDDNFKQSRIEFDEDSGAVDENGDRMFKNTDSNGRFHSDWCSMVYSRLRLARNLLSNDGVIFVSIDDHEQENMKKICSEVFGEENFIAQIIWERAFAPVNLKKHFSESHDYILCYGLNVELLECNGLPRTNDANSRYSNPDNDPRGPWTSSDMTVGPAIQDKLYEIITPNGTSLYPTSGRCWLFTKQRYEELKADNRIWFGENGGNMPRVKKFLNEVKQGMTPMTIWKYSEVGHSQEATKKLKELFDGKSFFDYPKPIELIKRCLQLYSTNDCIVMDFFSGSATTAHAVMELNAEDDGRRKFIMVQLPEMCEGGSEAYKAGYRNICEIGKERIRRAAKKIHEEHPDAKFDDGFRVLKVDESNMTDVYYSADSDNQNMLTLLESNIKPDRTDLDILLRCLLYRGLPL